MAARTRMRSFRVTGEKVRPPLRSIFVLVRTLDLAAKVTPLPVIREALTEIEAVATAAEAVVVAVPVAAHAAEAESLAAALVDSAGLAAGEIAESPTT